MRTDEDIADHAAKTVCGRLSRHSDSEDALQDARLGVALARRSFDATSDIPWEAWAFRRARSAVIDGLRQRWGRTNGARVVRRALPLSYFATPDGEDPDWLREIAAPDDPEREAIARVQLDEVVEYLDNERDRAVVIAAMNDEPNAVLATAWGMTESAISFRRRVVRERLRPLFT